MTTKDKKENVKVNKTSMATKLKKLTSKKEKMEVLKKEIEQLEAEIANAKNKEFYRLSMQYFNAKDDNTRMQLEAQIKILME